MNKFHGITRLSIVVFIIVAIISVSNTTFAQINKINVPFKGYGYLQPNLGASQYFGDFNKDDFWNQYPRLGFGAVLGYQLSPIFGVRGQFVKDNLYSKRVDQNKLLTSNLWDAALHLTININEIFADYNPKRFANFYVFTGAGFSSYKSKLENFSTNTIIDEHDTRQNTFVLPIGGGVAFRLSNTFSVNIEYSDRTVFSDTKLDFTSGNNKKNYDHYSYTSAGLQINFGVKDTDDDGVRDKDDLCVETFGKIDLAGCPDKDNDRIADKDDACPDIAGIPEFKGCPDTDGDGITDSEDDCPNAVGNKDLDGCPDKDNDRIADKDDKCPDVAGIKELAGCPDRDGDGITDMDDACPDVKGLAQYNGCPDTDGDGIADNLDKCPDVFGVVANFGCPEVKQIEYFKVVYFNFDKTVLVTKFIKDLDDVVASMKENSDTKLSIEGYADSQGPAAYNMKLSEKRADFVINYLAKQGISKDRLSKFFLGEGKPAADNKTKDGRAKNRRVEIRSIK
ncbi:MAG: OmpA family protein [Bacteroidales bacterium]|nr:OmpA family protein [Bacteroidales bacterium]